MAHTTTDVYTSIELSKADCEKLVEILKGVEQARIYANTCFDTDSLSVWIYGPNGTEDEIKF